MATKLQLQQALACVEDSLKYHELSVTRLRKTLAAAESRLALCKQERDAYQQELTRLERDEELT